MMTMKADAYLPVLIENLPTEFVFGPSGELLPAIRSYQQQGVVRVIGGAEKVHLIVDVQRPYFRRSRRPDVVEALPFAEVI